MDKIVIACDHRGDAFCEKINKHLIEKGYETIFFSSQSVKDDYIDNAKKALDALTKKQVTKAILVCGTGVGMAICANRKKGVFAVHAREESEAYFARRHEDANVLVFGAGYSDGIKEVRLCLRKAKRIVDTFLSTEFEGGRHAQRIKKVDRDL